MLLCTPSGPSEPLPHFERHIKSILPKQSLACVDGYAAVV